MLCKVASSSGSRFRHDGTDDGLTSLPGHIAQHLGELHIHLEQGLLHTQDMWGAVFEQLSVVIQPGAQGKQVGFRRD